MLKFLAKLLFVLFFLWSASQKIHDPTNHSRLLIDRFERFQNLGKNYNFEFLTSFISLNSLKLQANQINKVVGMGQIIISIGIVFSVPYISLFFSFFIILTILIVHNPLYYEDQEFFLNQLHNTVFEIAILGISLMLATNRKHIHDNNAKKNRKKKKKINSNEQENKKEGKAEKKMDHIENKAKKLKKK